MRRYGTALVAAWCVACAGQAYAVAVPDWLPAECRFEIEGTSNEAAQVEYTLALMRDAIHPKLRAMMDEDDLGPVLQWTVHVLQPDVTNDAAYFNTYAPTYKLRFDRDFLTNRISKLSQVPTQLDLKLLFDERRSDPVRRPVPGVDFPGVSSEDEGSTPHDIRIVLRAPKDDRRFRVHAEVKRPAFRGYEFEWVQLSGYGRAPEWTRRGRPATTSDIREFLPTYQACRRAGPGVMAVFARRKGQFWGAPSFIRVSTDPLCAHHYAKGRIEYIDYGDFRDEYKFDLEDKIVGFVRFRPGEVRGQAFSARGEFVRETYSEDRPRTVSLAHYRVEDGKLRYVIGDECLRRENLPTVLDVKVW